MTQLVAQVTGLTCQHCVNTVTTTLEAVEGIDQVAVELVNDGESTVTIGVSTTGDMVATIAQALAVDGYSLVSVSSGNTE